MVKRLRPHQMNTIGVKNILTESLRPNPHNPRLLFDREPHQALKNSIAKVGILVPLTVYRDSNKGDYVILDGQRRWICASELKMQYVPVNEVAEPGLVENIVTMFQIHKLRQDWELMPTALKLELLMGELKEKNEEKLSTLTSLPVAVVSRCKKLLSYPKKYQELMLDVSPEKRVKADFFIELYPILHDREVSKMDWFSHDSFVEQMLNKYGPTKPIKAVTDFRTVKQHINNAVRAGHSMELSHRLREFAEKSNAPISHLEIDTAKKSAIAKKLILDVDKLIMSLNGIDAGLFYGEERLWLKLTELMGVIQRKLKDADKR